MCWGMMEMENKKINTIIPHQTCIQRLIRSASHLCYKILSKPNLNIFFTIFCTFLRPPFLILAYKIAGFIPNKNHLRHAMLLFYHLKKNASEAAQMINEAYGENIITRMTVSRWYNKFRDGDFSLEDHQGVGGSHAKVFEDDEIEGLLEEDPFKTEEEMANELGTTG